MISSLCVLWLLLIVYSSYLQSLTMKSFVFISLKQPVYCTLAVIQPTTMGTEYLCVCVFLCECVFVCEFVLSSEPSTHWLQFFQLFLPFSFFSTFCTFVKWKTFPLQKVKQSQRETNLQSFYLSRLPLWQLEVKINPLFSPYGKKKKNSELSSCW